MEKKYIRLEELGSDHPLRQHPLDRQGVPEGYFDQLPSRVQARIAQKEQHSFLPDWSMSWSWRRTVASVAGAGLLAVLVWVTLPERQGSLGEEALSGISNEAIAAYLEEQGVNPLDLAEQQQVANSFASDTTLIQYLDVRPDAIRRQIETETDLDNLNLGS